MCMFIHMSVLYLGGEPAMLAERLAEHLEQHATHGDFFALAMIVVPNRFLRNGCGCISLASTASPSICASIISKCPLATAASGRSIGRAASETDENLYRLMVLGVLLESKASSLAPLQRHLQMDRGSLSCLSCRRAWELADRIGLLLRDYEYARQDCADPARLRHEPALSGGSGFHQMMERAHRTIFLDITGEPGGKRAR